MPDAPVTWLQTLVTYGPLGIFAAVIGFVWLMKQIKGDPVIKLAETCSAQIAIGNEFLRQNKESLDGVTAILRSSQTDDALRGKAIEVLDGKFDILAAEIRKSA